VKSSNGKYYVFGEGLAQSGGNHLLIKEVDIGKGDILNNHTDIEGYPLTLTLFVVNGHTVTVDPETGGTLP
jgi:hypothetical protein